MPEKKTTTGDTFSVETINASSLVNSSTIRHAKRIQVRPRPGHPSYKHGLAHQPLRHKRIHISSDNYHTPTRGRSISSTIILFYNAQGPPRHLRRHTVSEKRGHVNRRAPCGRLRYSYTPPFPLCLPKPATTTKQKPGQDYHLGGCRRGRRLST